MIALSHKTRFSHVVYVSSEENATTLFDVAKPGDTLHNVGECGEEESHALMNQINSQLTQGQYKELP